MKPFWRTQPLNAGEQRLLDAVLAAHELSAQRNNVSSQTVAINAQAAGDYGKAIAGAILTLGAMHGPIEKAHTLLSDGNPALLADELIMNGRRVPGFGNSFHRGVPDPLWKDVAALIRDTRLGPIFDGIRAVMMSHKRDLFPNPAGYTAATCLLLGIPREISCMIFLAGRLSAWSEIYLRSFRR